MPARHQPSVSRASRTAVIAGTGVAGLAALLTTPLAHAEPVPSNDTVAPADTTETGLTTSTTTDAPVTPNYGYQKYRVGVRGKDGDYYPDKTSTATTTFAVTVTPQEGKAETTSCASVANDPDVVTDATLCPGDDKFAPVFGGLRRRVAAVNSPSPDLDHTYVANPGDTITVTQTTVQDGMVKDTSTATLPPCVLTADDVSSVCGTKFDETTFDPFPTSTDLIFVDPGVPPLASDDTGTTKEGVPVTVNIAPNDDPKQAPIKSVAIASDPAHGTARLITAEKPDPTPSTSASSTSAGATATTVPPSISILARRPAGVRKLAAVTSYQAVYTPKAGFVGVDTFDYTITTANGSATAKVTVKVTGTAVDPTESSRGVDATSGGRDPIAETGTDSAQLVGYAAALLAAGGGALAIGRQRRRGRHAR